jgi:hypothetical protein
MSAPSLKVVVAITSPIAFQTLNSHSVLRTCIQESLAFIRHYGAQAHLAVAGSSQNLSQISDIEFEKIVCDPNDAHQFALAIQTAAPVDLVMIHDSQRALTQTAQFERVFQGLTGDIDAVRPISAFTETLKSVTNDQFVAGTIDRNSMSRISTPELIRFSSIDFLASTSTWFVPLKVDAKIAAVLADANSTRINSENDLKLTQNLMDPK